MTNVSFSHDFDHDLPSNVRISNHRFRRGKSSRFPSPQPIPTTTAR
jgi:hypothetical protein